MQKKMYCKTLAIGIIVLFIGAGVYPSSGIIVEEKSIIPTINGNTLYVGGDGPENYTKIQDAINDSVDGDTVFVYDDSSPYYENLVINKTINLIGENRDTTIIDGIGYAIYSVVFVSANEVTISGFTIQSSGNIVYDGLRIISESNIISNNIITSINRRAGIWIRTSSNNIITANTISNNKDGIQFVSTSYNTISDNTILNNGKGIVLSHSGQNNIKDNNITLNGDGMYLHKSSSNIIKNNNFLENERDVYFEDSFLNRWKKNYWNNQQRLPKLIIGKLLIFGQFGIPWFNIDWNPAQEPYDIGI
jgi:parallel beta-helix repeat protein